MCALPSGVRKNLLITLWLALPIAVFAGLIVWIFVSAGKPKAMHETPIGPGAGDTGGANALGEWLAGRDANDVERANIARREGRPIDPFIWPGGTEIRVPGDPDRPVSIGWIDARTGLLRSVVLLRGDHGWKTLLIDNRPKDGSAVYLCAGPMSQRIRGGEGVVVDGSGTPVVPFVVPPIVPVDTLASDPLVVELPAPG